MLKNNKTNRGFTIIEVLIVLAIAGLIMLIVFLAVPALQRNSRNTSRKNDVSRVLGAVQEVMNNNNGSVATTTLTSANIGTAAGTLGYYTAIPNATAMSSTSSAVVNTSTVDTIEVYVGAKCAPMATGGGQGATAGTSRQIAVTYTVEPATKQCTSS